mmetsp:Transcript_57240/g.136020  ORF Transcript_57240/g.136020 Transcript_57240/m.136020 type:complete len:388 (-) Transcript_57240:459-1622(-)
MRRQSSRHCRYPDLPTLLVYHMCLPGVLLRDSVSKGDLGVRARSSHGGSDLWLGLLRDWLRGAAERADRGVDAHLPLAYHGPRAPPANQRRCACAIPRRQPQQLAGSDIGADDCVRVLRGGSGRGGRQVDVLCHRPRPHVPGALRRVPLPLARHHALLRSRHRGGRHGGQPPPRDARVLPPLVDAAPTLLRAVDRGRVRDDRASHGGAVHCAGPLREEHLPDRPVGLPLGPPHREVEGRGAGSARRERRAGVRRGLQTRRDQPLHRQRACVYRVSGPPGGRRRGDTTTVSNSDAESDVVPSRGGAPRVRVRAGASANLPRDGFRRGLRPGDVPASDAVALLRVHSARVRGGVQPAGGGGKDATANTWAAEGPGGRGAQRAQGHPEHG